MANLQPIRLTHAFEAADARSLCYHRAEMTSDAHHASLYERNPEFLFNFCSNAAHHAQSFLHAERATVGRSIALECHRLQKERRRTTRVRRRTLGDRSAAPAPRESHPSHPKGRRPQP